MQSSTITTKVIPYAFPSKPNNEVFLYAYFAAYLPSCRPCNGLKPSHPRHHFGFSVSCRLSGHVSRVPQQLNSKKNGEFRGHSVESSLGSLVLSSVHLTIIFTNALINQAGSYYIISSFYLIWDRSQLYPVNFGMISLLLHSTSVPPQSRVITTISSL